MGSDASIEADSAPQQIPTSLDNTDVADSSTVQSDTHEEGTLPGTTAPVMPSGVPNAPTASIVDASAPDASVTYPEADTADAKAASMPEDSSTPDGPDALAPAAPEGGNAQAAPDPTTCSLSPVAPIGSFADCAETSDGGQCELSCPDGYIGGLATCLSGTWTDIACTPESRVSAVIGEAATGERQTGVMVYVEGYFNPLEVPAASDTDLTDACVASPFCKLTDENGELYFGRFPSGAQQVSVLGDGLDPIPLPVSTLPFEEASWRLDALPVGFLSGRIVITLNWSPHTDLDLTVRVPTTPESCIAFSHEGDLAEAPWAFFEHDSKVQGPDSIRIAQNEEHSGPSLNATYSVYVAAVVSASLQEAKPNVRVFRSSPAGAAQVDLFELPEDAIAEASA